MPINPRFLALAASLAAIPFAAALAQSNPTGNLGSNTSATASPGTADDKAASGLHTADVNAAHPLTTSAAKNYNPPGRTSRTAVHGTKSTVAADRAATTEQKTGNLAK